MSLVKIEHYLETGGWTRAVAGKDDFEAALLAIEQMSETRRGLIVSGEYGVGKTALAKLVTQAFGGAFESSFVHFDMEQEESCERENSCSWLSDGGKGARQIRRACDSQTNPAQERQRRIDRAKHLIARKASECLPVFWLVLKNGSNRKESIWQLVKKSISKKRESGPRQRPSISRH